MQITIATTLIVSFLGSTVAFVPHASSVRAFAVNSNGERPNTASDGVSLQLSRKRPRDKEESSNGNHPQNENGPVQNNAIDATEFVVDLELADEAEQVVRIERSGKNDAAGNCAETLEEIEATERDVVDSEQTSRYYGSAYKCSQKSSTAKALSNASGWQGRVWEDRLSELVDYRKIYGDCNVPQNYSENAKLAYWVGTQRTQYRFHREGKISHMTTFRIQELECLGFEWDSYGAAWKACFIELADYCKIHGHCNVPRRISENTKLAVWVKTQRKQYRFHLEGKPSAMTTFRIQELESMGFEWGSYIVAWEDRLSELADYCKEHRHCNVPSRYSENTKLGTWVKTQRKQYRFHLEGMKSAMTTSRIKELESLGFEWVIDVTAWKDRLSELANYSKIHGHCNVPRNGNPMLNYWVGRQRGQYKLHREGKISSITPLRIQNLESLGFEWDCSGPSGKTV
jgi:hypothetical protein